MNLADILHTIFSKAYFGIEPKVEVAELERAIVGSELSENTKEVMRKLSVIIQRTKLFDDIYDAHRRFDALCSQGRWCPKDKLDDARAGVMDAYAALKVFDKEHGLAPKLLGGPGPVNDWRDS
jgi:hypothetical protein